MAHKSTQVPNRCPWCGETVETFTENCHFCGRLPDWAAWVDSNHADAELRAPAGWQGLLTHEPLESLGQVAGFLRRELAGLRIVGGTERDQLWLELANELYANVFRALDALRIYDRPEQLPAADACDEIERRLSELWRWCATKSGDVGAASSTNVNTLLNNDESHPIHRLIRLLAGGIADDRVQQAAAILQNDTLTANEKLIKVNSVLPLPAKSSAEQLADLLNISKTAVLKTSWWKQNRKGEKADEVGRRREVYRRRSNNLDSDESDDLSSG